MGSFIRIATILLLGAIAQAQTITVPIEIVPEPKAIFVMAEINGHKVRLLVDTGSLATLALPARAGLTEGDLHQSTIVKAYDAHTSRPLPLVNADVRLGNVLFRVPVMFDDNLKLPSELGEIDGLLGLNVLTQFDSFRIDQKSHTLELSGLRK